MRIIIAFVTVIAVLAAAFIIVTGFQKRTDVILSDYSITENGTRITFNVHTASSAGFVRGFMDSGMSVSPTISPSITPSAALTAHSVQQASLRLPVMQIIQKSIFTVTYFSNAMNILSFPPD